ncbi:M48 family metallopeptidase [Pendulispora albinea]|uniref:M48 family metalloprotease n=1 Tax=Pendulispora albinea TaxID=2741071 RepID=A0ABZ2MAY0_9BACT
MDRDIRELRARRDLALGEQLRADSGVKRAIEKFRERASGYGFRHRRELLAGALRLNRTMAPHVADALAECREALGVREPVEMFVRPDPQFGAFCAKSPSGHIMIGVTSQLLQHFTAGELKFVLGHELGHVAFDHFAIPMPITATIEDLGGPIVGRATQLQLFVWCRAAEVSADRAGLLCARDPEVAARAFFKMASGITSDVIRPDLRAFVEQVESIVSAPAARVKPRDDDDTLDCFSTHPYTPVRVRALLAFARSRAYASFIGASQGGELDQDQVEAVVERDLALMEPTYLEETTAESSFMRRLLYHAGVSVAAANGVITESEQSALHALLGHDQAGAPSAPEASARELDALLASAPERVPLSGRLQLVQHLTIIAAADGCVDASERDAIARIAGRLGVDERIVDQTLAGAASPMD